MKFVGFNFTKISIEKMSDSLKGVKLNTKIDLVDIAPVETPLMKADQQLLSIKFSHMINYDPDIAKIELAGRILIAMDKENAKDIIDSWKDKKVSEDFRLALFNIVLRKSNVKAFELEEQMNLPLHIPLPTLKRPKKA